MRSAHQNNEDGGWTSQLAADLLDKTPFSSEMATQKAGGWVQSLITRFDSQVGTIFRACPRHLRADFCFFVGDPQFRAEPMRSPFIKFCE